MTNRQPQSASKARLVAKAESVVQPEIADYERRPDCIYDDWLEDEDAPQFHAPTSTKESVEAVAQCVTLGMGAAGVRGMTNLGDEDRLLVQLEVALRREYWRVKGRRSVIQTFLSQSLTVA